jgi:hypothetical protein
MSLSQLFVAHTAMWFLAFLTSCAVPPKLRNGNLQIRELIESAPIVIVGVVEKVEWLRAKAQYLGSPEKNATLRAITLRAEARLKGNIPDRFVTIYRYDCHENCLGVPVTDPVSIGSRHAFFLTKEGSRYRSVLDLVTSSVPIYTGSHTDEVGNVEERLSKFLLTPGKQFDPHTFAQGLFTARYYSRELVGKAKTIEYVKQYIDSPAADLRYASCLASSRRTPI